MTLRHGVTALLVILLAAAAVFRLKYAVVGLERDLAALQVEIDEERWRLRLRRADLAVLTRPDRLALQAKQLGLEPARAQQIVTIESIGSRAQIELARSPLEVPLPGGGPGMLRARPLEVAARGAERR
jgi:hypothetical protein